MRHSILITQLFIVFGFTITITFAQHAEDPDPLRFESQIHTFQDWDRKNSFVENAILFTGSSSVRLWNTATAFPDYPVLNRGFGGSHLSDVKAHYESVIAPYKPSVLVLYAGDNDVASGKSAEQILSDYTNLAEKFLADFPDGKLLFISIKPSKSRWDFWPKMKEINKTVENYNQKQERLYYVDLASPLLDNSHKPDPSLFSDDLLHLNENGYKVWTENIEPVLLNILNE